MSFISPQLTLKELGSPVSRCLTPWSVAAYVIRCKCRTLYSISGVCAEAHWMFQERHWHGCQHLGCSAYLSKLIIVKSGRLRTLFSLNELRGEAAAAQARQSLTPPMFRPEKIRRPTTSLRQAETSEETAFDFELSSRNSCNSTRLQHSFLSVLSLRPFSLRATFVADGLI